MAPNAAKPAPAAAGNRLQGGVAGKHHNLTPDSRSPRQIQAPDRLSQDQQRALDYFDVRGCPDLHRLIEIFGGYSAVPQWAWLKWDADTAAHRARMVTIESGNSTQVVRVNPFRPYPPQDECCHCYQRSIFGYRAALAESSDLIWFCDQHKPAKHFADARRDK